jgi:DNA primase
VVGRQHKFFNTENRFYKEADTGNFLFGEDKVIGDSVIVVESELDCVWAWQHNLFNVVAIGGTPSKEQIKKLRNYREIILWLDNDNPGIWSSRMINYSLKKTNQIYTVNYLSDKKDLGEMDMEEIWNTWRTRHLVLVTEIGEL